MHSFLKTTLRTSTAAALIIGLTTSAFARSAVNRVFLHCNHEDTLSEFTVIPEVGPVPMVMDLEVAGAGMGTMMSGLVVCVSENYFFTRGGAVGSATFKLRDMNGDVLVYKTTEIATWPTPTGPHFAEFAGRYEVDTPRCTGRYTDATGVGYIEGWAENDGAPVEVEGQPGVMKSSGQGYAEMTGTLILKKKGCLKR